MCIFVFHKKLDNLFETQASLSLRHYEPARCIRFVAAKPKAREIHAVHA